MYRLMVTGKFSSAHRLRGYQGGCEALHGHTWRVEVEFEADRLDAIGLALDFKRLKQALRDVVALLDHHDLNAVPPFDGINPSAENLARFVHDEMARRLVDEPVRVSAAHVWESEDARATYLPD